jgi:TolB protein
MNADGSSLTQLNHLTDAHSPNWASDGTNIVYIASPHPFTSSEIYIMNADGSNQINLTNNSAGDINPDWSPDGTQIAFVRFIEGEDTIFLMSANGENQRRLLNITCSHPRWSPDGKLVAYQSHNFVDIWTVNINDKNKKRLTTAGGMDLYPAWCP